MNNNLIYLNVDGIRNTKDALMYLGNKLVTAGFVKETFPDALIEREKVFPTGLQFPHYGVAIPHTDAVHVNETKVAIMTMTNPVEFVQMGSESQKVPVSLVIMLAIKESHSQVEMLQKLMGVLQNENLVQSILESDNSEIVENLLKTNDII